MQNKELIRSFLETVRSGKDPGRAAEFMAPTILAHQIVSEQEITVRRTPENYVEHVQSMLATFGRFDLKILELLEDADKVYARWRQTGVHLGEVDGYAPTGKPVVEVASAVYRLVEGQIAEYWIQIDRSGLQIQLERDRPKE
jgi:predicted ester cyclase